MVDIWPAHEASWCDLFPAMASLTGQVAQLLHCPTVNIRAAKHEKSWYGSRFAAGKLKVKREEVGSVQGQARGKNRRPVADSGIDDQLKAEASK